MFSHKLVKNICLLQMQREKERRGATEKDTFHPLALLPICLQQPELEENATGSQELHLILSHASFTTFTGALVSMEIRDRVAGN